jgi:hypothetical protein
MKDKMDNEIKDGDIMEIASCVDIIRQESDIYTLCCTLDDKLKGLIMLNFTDDIYGLKVDSIIRKQVELQDLKSLFLSSYMMEVSK